MRSFSWLILPLKNFDTINDLGVSTSSCMVSVAHRMGPFLHSNYPDTYGFRQVTIDPSTQTI